MATQSGGVVIGTGAQVLLHGVIVDTRDDFALVAVAGCQPSGGYIAVEYDALTVEFPVEPPT